MKTITAILFSLVLSSIAFAGEPASKEVQLAIPEVYVPGGFDSSSDVYVVASGMFPNSCYGWSRSEVEHTSATTHEVRSYANVRSGMCLMVLVPFTKEIHMGVLGAGKHTLRFVNGDGTYSEKVLTIEE